MNKLGVIESHLRNHPEVGSPAHQKNRCSRHRFILIHLIFLLMQLNAEHQSDT